jgi:hypothetical protein
MERQKSARTWFCVLNNPEKVLGDGQPENLVEQAAALWMTNENRSCAINYEIGDEGHTPHMHMVLCDKTKSRFSAVQKLYPSIHIEPLLGKRKDALEYIEKTGRFNEKSHTIIVPARYYGDIQGRQGKRTDLEQIEQMIAEGYTPNEIMDISICYRKYEKMIRGAFFSHRMKEVPVKREVKVYWHTGESGTGKSYCFVSLCEKYGEKNVYIMTDYQSGGLDLYCGEPCLVMDEFKGNMRFGELLNYLDGYKIQIHCRYANAFALWSEVHITSIYAPDEVYEFMVDSNNRNRDRVQQLLRRIDKIIYHYIDHGEYKQYELPASEYINYTDLKQRAECGVDQDGFIRITEEEQPF